MATLKGNQIKDTYYKLVQVDDGQLVQNGIGSPLTGSIKLSGSLHVTGSQTVGGNLTVTGDVTARSFITELTQSTVLYKSGSTAFGDDATDTHSFSGSVTMHNSLALGNYANVSASLDAAEDAIIANSQSAHTHRVALDTILSASVDAHLDANISALSASTDSHLDSEIALLSASVDTHLDANITSLSGSSHTRREEISSSFATTIAGLDASGFATDAELSTVSGAFATTQATQDNTIATLASTGSNTFTGDQTISSSLYVSGTLYPNGNIININEDARVVAFPGRVQFRIIPTASGHLRAHLATTFDAVDNKTNVSLYGEQVELGTYVEDGLYTETIKLGTTGSLFTISGSTEMTGSLVISGAIDSNEKANKIRFHYDTEGDLPSATDYHGMFAHVHATGLGYFAHGGNWIKLANSGSEASAIRAEYVAADTALSTSLATNVSANTADIATLTAATSSYAASSSLYYVKRTLSQSISYDSGYVDKTLEYETGSIDQGGADAMWDTGSFRFTPTVSGLWYINSQVDVPDGSTAKLNIEKNGTVIASQRGTISGTPATFNASTHVVLNGSTDYIQFKANSQSGGTESQSPERAFFEALLVKEI